MLSTATFGQWMPSSGRASCSHFLASAAAGSVAQCRRSNRVSARRGSWRGQKRKRGRLLPPPPLVSLEPADCMKPSRQTSILCMHKVAALVQGPGVSSRQTRRLNSLNRYSNARAQPGRLAPFDTIVFIVSQTPRLILRTSMLPRRGEPPGSVWWCSCRRRTRRSRARLLS